MSELSAQYKNCPSCRRQTPIAECKKIVSRSSGKETISWRCIRCYERRRGISPTNSEK